MAILDAELRRGLAYVIPYKGRLAFILGLNLAGVHGWRKWPERT